VEPAERDAVTHGVAWKGLILAPDATVTSNNRPQLRGQLIAKTIPHERLGPHLCPVHRLSAARVGLPRSILDRVCFGAPRDPGRIDLRCGSPERRSEPHRNDHLQAARTRRRTLHGDCGLLVDRDGHPRRLLRLGIVHTRESREVPLGGRHSGDRNNNPAGPTACGDDSETVKVTRAITTLTTDVPDRFERVGSEIYDTANLEDGVSPTGGLTFKLYGPDDATCSRPPIFRGAQPTGQITFTLYGPNDSTCTRAPVFTTATTVNGNGAYNSERFTPAVSGVYR
jgi:hypothetical protein